jgi:hypothetical protein
MNTDCLTSASKYLPSGISGYRFSPGVVPAVLFPHHQIHPNKNLWSTPHPWQGIKPIYVYFTNNIITARSKKEREKKVFF